jgi:hypothetical protein
MEGGKVALPEAHIFRLTRRPAAMALLTWTALGGAAWFFASAEGSALAHTVWAILPRLLILLAWVGITLSLLGTVVSKPPHSVAVDAEGLHPSWPDRAEHWPWAAVRWRLDGAYGGAVVSEAGTSGVPIVCLRRDERGLFWDLLTQHGGATLVEREVERLQAGEPMRLSAAERWSALLVNLALAAWLARCAGDMFVSWRHDFNHWPTDGPLAFWLGVTRVVMGVAAIAAFGLPLAAVAAGLHQRWFAIRFLPEGLEERWPLGRRLWPYAGLDHIVFHCQGRFGRWVTIRSGRRKLELGGNLPCFRGALQLLRERAPQAQWEERP